MLGAATRLSRSHLIRRRLDVARVRGLVTLALLHSLECACYVVVAAAAAILSKSMLSRAL